MNIKKKTYEYLETKNCLKKEFYKIKVKHSFLNKVLSYDEWNLNVNLYGKYEYTFTYKNNEVLLKGINDQEKISKEEYQELIEKLENGLICKEIEEMTLEKSDYILSDDLVSLKIKEDSLTNSMVTIILNNQTNDTYMYGEPYSIEYEKEGSWYQLNPIIEHYGFTLIGYNLKPKESKEVKIDWEWIYGKLSEGKYRIIKDVFLANSNGYPKVFIGAEFTIS